MCKIKIFNYGFVIQRFNLQVVGSSFVACKDLVLLQPNKNFMKKAILLALFFTVVSFSQTNYPQDYFIAPLDIPMQLSGNFGELRPNHFHAGFDFKTNQKEGLNVYATADGYVSRIKVSTAGYGKAIYVSHPNGYTTVYGHLQRYQGKIQDKVIELQYKAQDYEVEAFFKPGEIPVKQGDIIGISGNTGGSEGPHLHYEIRNSKTEKIINPLFFGYKLKDTKKPIVNTLLVYPLDKNSVVNESKRPIALSLSLQEDGTYIAQKVMATGKIGFAISSYDTDDVSYNANGTYKTTLSSNGKDVFGYEFDEMAFDEARYVNALIDYGRYKKMKQRIQRLFMTLPYNWENIKSNINNGVFDVTPNLTDVKKITVYDYVGNKTEIFVPVAYSSNQAKIPSDVKTTKYFVKAKTDALFEKDNISVYFPANTFYEDFYLNFDVKGNTLYLHEDIVPTHNNFTITFDNINLPDSEKNKSFIAMVVNGKQQYYTTKRDGSTFSCKSKLLGQYTIAKDTIAPKITIAKSIENKWITNQKSITLTISDDFSGVKKFDGYINDKWVLFEYEPKTKKIMHQFVDENLKEGLNKLKVVVADNVGNSATFETQFNRSQKK